MLLLRIATFVSKFSVCTTLVSVPNFGNTRCLKSGLKLLKADLLPKVKRSKMRKVSAASTFERKVNSFASKPSAGAIKIYHTAPIFSSKI